MDCPWIKLVNLGVIPTNNIYPWNSLDSPWTVHGVHGFHGQTVDCVA